MGKVFKYLKKKFGKGFTFLVIPNSSGTVKSISIPFSVIIFIGIIIIFNILIFAGFTSQVWQIYHIRQQLWIKDSKIAKLRREQAKIQPTLQKSYQMADELNRLKMERAKIMATWKVIKKKGGRLGVPVSRSRTFRIPTYDLNQSKRVSNTISSIAVLNKNLDQLGKYIDHESEKDKTLLKELLTYDTRLDHIPTIWPVSCHRISSVFGKRFHPLFHQYRMHTGVDIAASYGSKVVAAADGVVTFAGARSGYGNMVIIDHEFGYKTVYGHNSKILVRNGDHVEKGDLISYSGNSGTSTGPHLHYEVREDGNPINPVPFLRN